MKGATLLYKGEAFVEFFDSLNMAKNELEDRLRLSINSTEHLAISS